MTVVALNNQGVNEFFRFYKNKNLQIIQLLIPINKKYVAFFTRLLRFDPWEKVSLNVLRIKRFLQLVKTVSFAELSKINCSKSRDRHAFLNHDWSPGEKNYQYFHLFINQCSIALQSKLRTLDSINKRQSHTT